MTPQEEIDLYSNAKLALRFFTEHTLWREYINYENHIIQKLTFEAAQGNLSHPNFAIQKAYLQGRLDSLMMLQNGRKELLKQGDTNDNPQSVHPGSQSGNPRQLRTSKRTRPLGRFDDFKV